MTRVVPQGRPSESGRPGDLARLLARLLGPAWQAGDGSTTAAEMLAEGDALDDATTQLELAHAQAFAAEATVSLEDWERVLDLPLDVLSTTTTRRALVVARLRGTLSGAPEDLLAAVQSLVPGATVRERTTTDAAALGSAREVFRLRFALGASYTDAELVAKVGAILRAALPAHATHDVGPYEYDALLVEDGDELADETGDTLTTEA